MTRDPLARLPTTARLWAAAGLSVLPLGLYWSSTPGLQTIGTTIYGDCGYDAGDNYVCNPDTYIPGVYLPGSTSLVSQSPLRVFLVGAFVALVLVAVRTRTAATRRVARAATVCLLVAAVLAAGHGSSRVLVCVLAALVLCAPPAWRTRPDAAAFGTGPGGR